MNTAEAAAAGALAPLPPHVPQELVVDFDMYNPPNVAENLQDAWTVLQAPGVPDVVWTQRNGGHWIIANGQLIRGVYENSGIFSSECPIIPKENGEFYDFIPSVLDAPDHRHFRAVISQGVSMPVVNGAEDKIRELAIDLIEKLRPQGHCNFTEDFADAFPIQIFLMLANLPQSDGQGLKRIVDAMTRPNGEMTFVEARDALHDYLSPFIDERMANPGDDAISKIANSKVYGRPITKLEALQVGTMLLAGGVDTVVNFLSFMMQFLAQSPEHRKELIDHPERIPAAAEELLRRFPLVLNARTIKSDIEFHGVQMKKGDQVLLPTLLPGLDERENACPMHVDFSRKKVSHTTFGHGAHQCVGQHLARREIVIMLKEWLARIPDFQIAPGAKIVHQSGIVGAVTALPLVWDPATTTAKP